MTVSSLVHQINPLCSMSTAGAVGVVQPAHAIIRAASKANGYSEEMLAAMRATDRWRVGRSEDERDAAAAAGRRDIDAQLQEQNCVWLLTVRRVWRVRRLQRLRALLGSLVR